ncbi:MAG: hypothetical protein AMXMBFR57_37520 [Acidimicrobiia bacterium]
MSRTSRLSIVCLLVSTGLLAAGCEQIRNLTSPVSGAGSTTVHYTALGASDTSGYGGTVACPPFTACPNGSGYVQIVGRRLQAAQPETKLSNLGVPGAVISRRLQNLGNEVGLGIVNNFTDGQAPFVPRDTTLVTMFAGGNDANAVAAYLRAGHVSGSVDAYIEAQISAFASDLRTLLDSVRARATGATFILLNLPNMARLPYTDSATPTEREWFRRLTVGFSSAINAVRAPDVQVIDLMCHAPVYNRGIYSADGFHPNDQGYLLLADLVSAALATAPSAPQTSCGFMQ